MEAAPSASGWSSAQPVQPRRHGWRGRARRPRAPIRIGRQELVQEAGVALAVTAAATLVIAGALPAWIGLAACGLAAFLYIGGSRPSAAPPGSLPPAGHWDRGARAARDRADRPREPRHGGCRARPGRPLGHARRCRRHGRPGLAHEPPERLHRVSARAGGARRRPRQRGASLEQHQHGRRPRDPRPLRHDHRRLRCRARAALRADGAHPCPARPQRRPRSPRGGCDRHRLRRGRGDTRR